MAEPTNKQIVQVLEAAGVHFQAFQHAITRKTFWSTAGSQPVDKLCDGIRSLIRAAGVTPAPAPADPGMPDLLRMSRYEADRTLSTYASHIRAGNTKEAGELATKIMRYVTGNPNPIGADRLAGHAGVMAPPAPSTADEIVRLACEWYDTGVGKPDVAHRLEMAVMRHKKAEATPTP